MSKHQGQRMGMVIGLNPEKVAKYKRYMRRSGLEILALISECNITNYSIFLKEPENLLLLGYWEYVRQRFCSRHEENGRKPQKSGMVVGLYAMPRNRLKPAKRVEWWQ